MTRLSRYLFRLCSAQALALFAIAALLMFLTQCVNEFDLVTEKGQNLWTLFCFAVLTMPGAAVIILYICLGIGLGRALHNLRASNEMPVIHLEGLLPAMFSAIVIYTIAGSVVLLLLAHVVDPLSQRVTNQWSSSIAADLVSRSLVPHQFADIASDVSVVINGRDGEGNITGFFADDHRSVAARQTYFANRAIITHDEQGYILRMTDGAIQYFTDDKRISEVTFARYDLALDELTGAQRDSDPLPRTPSYELVATAAASGQWTDDIVLALLKRSGEALRIVAMMTFVTAIAAFPAGSRRRFTFPIELVVLVAAFVERGITSNVTTRGALGLGAGAMLLLVSGAVILIVRLRVFRPHRARLVPA